MGKESIQARGNGGTLPGSILDCELVRAEAQVLAIKSQSRMRCVQGRLRLVLAREVDSTNVGRGVAKFVGRSRVNTPKKDLANPAMVLDSLALVIYDK